VRNYQVLLGEQQASQIRCHYGPAAKPCRSQPAAALAQRAAAAAEGHIAAAEDTLTLWLLDAPSNCNAKGLLEHRQAELAAAAAAQEAWHAQHAGEVAACEATEQLAVQHQR
jgi:hypothetical protein